MSAQTRVPPSTREVGPISTRSMLRLGGMLALLFLGLLLLGGVPRMRAQRALAAEAKATRTALATVFVVPPQPATAADLVLAGTTQALRAATVYARTSGYVRRRHVDIGDSVHAGQLLAEIASPEVEQQLHQARAEQRQAQRTLEQQRESRDLAQLTRTRYRAADAERAVAKEMVDQSATALKTAQAAVAAATANVQSNAANVRRLEELLGFERVVAPFDGTVTRRNIDDGALITAGSPMTDTTANNTASGMFEVAQLDVLRVFVNLPQVDAPNVKLGMPARIYVRGHLEYPVIAQVTRMAHALDPSTRTMRVEVDIPNQPHLLFPGMFVYVAFSIAPSGRHFRVPATAVMIDAQGPRVITVGDHDRLHIQPVVLARDFGETIDVQAGLQGDERIVRQPRVSLHEGQQVHARDYSSGD